MAELLYAVLELRKDEPPLFSVCGWAHPNTKVDGSRHNTEADRSRHALCQELSQHKFECFRMSRVARDNLALRGAKRQPSAGCGVGKARRDHSEVLGMTEKASDIIGTRANHGMSVMSCKAMNEISNMRIKGEKANDRGQRTTLEDTRGNDKNEKGPTFLKSVRHVTSVHRFQSVVEPLGGSEVPHCCEYRVVCQARERRDQ